jgi:hypothetical protein
MKNKKSGNPKVIVTWGDPSTLSPEERRYRKTLWEKFWVKIITETMEKEEEDKKNK